MLLENLTNINEDFHHGAFRSRLSFSCSSRRPAIIKNVKVWIKTKRLMYVHVCTCANGICVYNLHVILKTEQKHTIQTLFTELLAVGLTSIIFVKSLQKEKRLSHQIGIISLPFEPLHRENS